MIIIFRYDLKYFKIYYFNFNQLNQKESLNIKIFKVQNSIYFVNCENFQKSLYKKYGFSPIDKILSAAKNKSKIDESSIDPDIILDFSAVNYIDTNGIKTLQQIIEDFKKVNVFVYICEPQGIKIFHNNRFFNFQVIFLFLILDNVIQILYRMKILSKFDQHIFVTIFDAIADFRNKKAI